ncbi:DUF6891 domain-containing protein [Roseateles sp. NT4]|uniref:DUF6891 domain-containing protein n=1 Tax=Roseateles sp. NT4 TaxID=3453715 RepID=UPI003EEEDF12
MSNNTPWNDDSREELRTRLKNLVLGEVRLAQSDPDDILQTCREVYIEDECPAEEQDAFTRFAAEEMDKAMASHALEKKSWPAETDCDRLDRVEADLRDRGILLWQVSPCCDTCTRSELPERIDEIDQQHAGFRQRVRGYAFFIDQNMADALAEGSHLSVYLGYGCFMPDDAEAAHDVYETHALGIAREVCDRLVEHGFEPGWDGSLSKKIGLHLNWQRRQA